MEKERYLLAILALLLGSTQAFSLAESGIDPSVLTFRDLDGQEITLDQGESSILFMGSIEYPLCLECEPSLRAQLTELDRLDAIDPVINIITLNIRKNPFSKDGRALARSWWGLNISWLWADDMEPYPISRELIDYATVDGGFSNPTLLLIDGDGQVSRVYHVYRMGQGNQEGVVDAASLLKALDELDREVGKGANGELGGSVDGDLSRGVDGYVDASSQSYSYLGMFFLGIVTSLAPCSIALMVAIFSYIMTSRRREEYLHGSGSLEGFMIGLAFTFGMGLVFFMIGFFISHIGVFVREARTFDLLAGLIMIMLGINGLWPLDGLLSPIKSRLNLGQGERSFLERTVGLSMDLFKYSALLGAFTLGVFFALGWAPCAVSLVFPVLIWLASQQVAPLVGGLMLFSFGLGHGVPVIPISTFSRKVAGKVGDRYLQAGQYLTAVFSSAVILVGLAYAARYFGLALW
ncbi:MAG: cytochrome c biogenesis protein CcdA [Methanotrichaceae archaeon]|nr:cytochrome c biogenesis protein CcdA [Methanotrichaceae archaeon]